GQLDLSEDKAFVLAFEDVDLPSLPYILDDIARLLDDVSQAQAQKFFRLGSRDFIFEFRAADAVGLAFDGELAFVAEAAQPHRTLGIKTQIALLDVCFAHRIAPTIAGYQELAFDLLAHGVAHLRVRAVQCWVRSRRTAVARASFLCRSRAARSSSIFSQSRASFSGLSRDALRCAFTMTSAQRTTSASTPIFASVLASTILRTRRP